MELSMDNMDIMAGGILAIMLALFMLTVIVTLFALSHRIRLLSNEIYKIEKQVSDYIDELSRSESDKLEIEHKAHQNGGDFIGASGDFSVKFDKMLLL